MGFLLIRWEKDKTLASDDMHRTIFNPYNNLNCGIESMASITHDTQSIPTPRTKATGRLSRSRVGTRRLAEHQSELHRLFFCGPPLVEACGERVHALRES